MIISDSLRTKDFLSFADISQEEFEGLLESAKAFKQLLKNRQDHTWLKGKSIALIFEKPSLRTRTTFDLAMYHLGGHAIYLSQQEISLGKRETIRDIASNLERWLDGLVVRTFGHAGIVELAHHSHIPVINALTDFLHPCQLLADYLTLKERFGDLKGLKLTYVGDGNNVANSHINAAALAGVELTIACPEGFDPDASLMARARKMGGKLNIVRNPREAVLGADVLYTDVWVSMGQEAETERRRRAFQGYTITPEWLEELSPKGVFMHDLPAHYGEECTEGCVYHERSVVFEQAENRLHAHKALLFQLLRDAESELG